METLAELLTTGDTGSLVLAVLLLGAGALLASLAVRLRPRPRRR